MSFILIFLFVHLQEILAKNMRVELRIAIDLNEDKHPNQNIIACCYFIERKKL